MRVIKGKCYEIIENRNKNGTKYHAYPIGKVVECVLADLGRSVFSPDGSFGNCQSIYNAHVEPVNEKLVSIWNK